jgi:hypothetical protein
MRSLMAALVAVPIAVSSLLGNPVPAQADPVPLPPPYVDHTEWVSSGGLSSLRVYPTPAGRAASGRLGTSSKQGAEAWSEVLASAPDADTPGMRAQFLCHWQFAELVEPGKTSWNLEPWRPVVDPNEMVSSGCNPGGPEKAF